MRIRIGPAKEVLAMPTIATTRVKDALAAGNVEGARIQDLPRQELMPRQKARHRGQLPGDAIVMVLYERPIFGIGFLAVLLRFQRLLDRTRDGIFLVSSFRQRLR